MAFAFSTVPEIVSKPGIAGDLSIVLGGSKPQSILVVTDPKLLQSNIIAPLLTALEKSNQRTAIFSEVMADPPESVIEKGVKAAIKHSVDFVIGVGGGSSLDTAKLIALLAHSPQSMEQIYGVNQATGNRLPLVLIPTTAGTGSEVTPVAVVTSASQEKKGVVSNLLLADRALLDAKLTTALPAEITAATGIDAAVHAIEAYTSKLLKNPVSDALALKAISLLFHNLPLVLKNRGDLEARGAMLEGAMLAGMAFANAPVAAVHALAYPLGAHFHLPHGLCNALMLQPVLKFNLEAFPSLYDGLAREIGGSPPAESGAWFLQAMQTFCSHSTIPRKLREVGVAEDDLPGLAEDAMKIDRLLRNNPRTLEYPDALRLYQEAW